MACMHAQLHLDKYSPYSESSSQYNLAIMTLGEAAQLCLHSESTSSPKAQGQPNKEDLPPVEEETGNSERIKRSC